MEDLRSIAWLSPAIPENHNKEFENGEYTWEAMRMNVSQDIPRLQKTGLRSRESTAPLEDEEDETAGAASYPRLHLTFGSEVRGLGIVIGTDPSCEIPVPKVPHISRHHCHLTFDNQRRLILRDTSKHGTIVEYDGKGGELRRHFPWILGGCRTTQDTKKIVIKIQGIAFQIQVTHHDLDPEQYNANVDRFRQEESEPHLNGLGIYDPTAPPSQSRTPDQEPLRLKQETLGKGAFAVVRRYWDVSTGDEYAYKEPINKRKFRKDLWDREIEIMRQISHNHVVKLIGSTKEPSPQLVLEYVPYGNLEGISLTIEETMTVLCQGLSALQDLHERRDPIVHRDIKPANILLQSRDPLHIKLADFGLSRAKDDLTTMCGTAMYLAPEVWRGKKYTPVVDIWSFGVVAFECAYDLPDHDEYRGRDWCQLLVDQVNDWDDNDLIHLLSNAMIVMDPKSRGSARYCYQEALRLVASQERSLTPTPRSYAKGDYLADTRQQNSFGQVGDPSGSFHSSSQYVRCDEPSPPSKVPTIVIDPRSDLQRQESVPGIDLFGQDWLQDPNCVGSSVAAMGEESSSGLSGWESWPSVASVPRAGPLSVGTQNDGSHFYIGQEHLARDSHVFDTGNHHYTYQGEMAPAQNGPVIATAHHKRTETAWTSDDYIAARLLQGMHDEGWT